MSMKLDGLIHLYHSMISQNIERYRHEYKAGKATFDVFFFIDGSPFILLFGVKGGNFSFEVKVKKGFIISTYLDRDTYKKLCEALGLKYDPNRRFNPGKFFAEYNRKIPAVAYLFQKARPQDVAIYRNVYEESDKVYFFGWRDNYKRNTRVQESNLDKTRKLLGEKAYRRCEEKNISSCWTGNKEAAIEFQMPE